MKKLLVAFLVGAAVFWAALHAHNRTFQDSTEIGDHVAIKNGKNLFPEANSRNIVVGCHPRTINHDTGDQCDSFHVFDDGDEVVVVDSDAIFVAVHAKDDQGVFWIPKIYVGALGARK